jgi:hypothetical protein
MLRDAPACYMLLLDAIKHLSQSELSFSYDYVWSPKSTHLSQQSLG